jgi:hypothetical protein
MLLIKKIMSKYMNYVVIAYVMDQFNSVVCNGI